MSSGQSDLTSSVQHDSFIEAQSRGITGPCINSRFGVSFDTADGTVRLSLKRDDLIRFLHAAKAYIAMK